MRKKMRMTMVWSFGVKAMMMQLMPRTRRTETVIQRRPRRSIVKYRKMLGRTLVGY
jgi:hypothetical protein